ncbi:EAL domain-containing protein [Mesorhizobium sp. B2-3-4]|uniref:EAL domain-containing protein n=1 Tax=Mesorhizobium sp. B2-3-4 TaxID=2589959 RepID=UPI00112E526D|nr:EAL domain-containing protein [Mesorhizobium sp. B2-3-4]TPM34274.1 EAL domain-containing protein [Mesorhizobium sp. B2-3-4]
MARQGKKSRDGTRWERALERAHLGVWDWDLRTGDCFYSATWARMLGYSQDELANTSDLWFRLTHPDDRERALASGDRHIAGLTDAIETELRLKHKQGHWVWVLDRGGIVERDAAGRPLRLMGVQTDISRQKAAEAELEQVNVRFRLALAASGTGIWHHDIATRKSYWDTRTREIFGLVADTDEVSADLWHTYLHPDDKEATERVHQVSLGTDTIIASQYRIVRRDGCVRHVESLVRFIAAGEAGQILGTVRDITEDKLREQELAYAARHDALTGLLNRAAFDRLLADHIATGAPLAVFYVDLDYFKALNDFAGHAAGDLALKSVAAGIGRCLPPSAHAARLGGDEFALLVPDCDAAEAERLAGAILAAVRDADLGLAATSRRLAASIGIAIVHDRLTTVADALACADDACYAAKAAGRDRFALFSADAASGSGGLNAARLAADTVDAMEDGRLKLFGQQIHRLGRPWQENRHVEVLARLDGKGGRLIPPGEFIPAAERFGIAARLDRWIIRTALSRHGAAMKSGAVTLGFNLSAQTLSDPGLWDFVDRIIEETGAPHQGIGFEITETAAVTNFDAAETFVRKARERRCRVSLDDFGAGMSSFEYLRRFPVDAIKIDGSFIEHITESRFDREIVLAITSIARSLGCAVVAEKIERQDTVAMLRDMGVEFGQGFLLHRPEPLQHIVSHAAGPAREAAAREAS